MRCAFLIGVALFACVASAAEDFRPKFDKSDYRGTVGVHVNPWFPLNKPPIHALGGPNRAWKHYEGKDIWAQGMRDILPYGVAMWELEINEPASWAEVWSDMLRQAASNNVPVKVGMFFGFYSKTQDESFAALKGIFGPMRETLKSSPWISRAGGFPIMQVYNPGKYKPAEWGAFFARVDAEFGRMIYLLDVGKIVVMAMRGGGDEAAVDARFEKILREYLPHFDGVSGYGNGLRIPFKVLSRVMADFPQKIYEGQAHFTYTCHFHMGGLDVHLSEGWRKHLDDCLAGNPDSILLTNLFDHYENSLVLPCYDREDFVLRYFECRAADWRKVPFRREKTPELVVTGYTTVLLGWQDLAFEVIGFPIDSKDDLVTLHLDLCDASGKVVHMFAPREMRLDALRVETFSIPSVDLVGLRGVVPRLRYVWAGHERAMNYGPLTVIDPSIRGYRMYWARSTKNELKVRGDGRWTMDGVPQGGTHLPQNLGISIVSSTLQPAFGQGPRTGSSRYGLKRDNVELYYTDAPGKGPCGELALQTPPPGSALHWYYLEMENAKGPKFQTLPIWETDGTRDRKVRVPVWTKDGAIVYYEVEECRVPYWYYPLEADAGYLLVDQSGWGHNGAINGRSGFAGGHLGYTGYNHYHNGMIPMAPNGVSGLYGREADGMGYLSFNGSNDYVIIQGGTAFPGAFTYEFSVRPREIGLREQGLLGTGNNQLSVTLMKTGRLRVSRRSANEDAGGEKPQKTVESKFDSTVKLVAGKWHRVAIVYDLRKLTLFVDGQEAGSCAASPMRGHEWLNHIILAAHCGWVWTPQDHFKGDLAMIRLTGRNLTPSEFLNSSP